MGGENHLSFPFSTHNTFFCWILLLFSQLSFWVMNPEDEEKHLQAKQKKDPEREGAKKVKTDEKPNGRTEKWGVSLHENRTESGRRLHSTGGEAGAGSSFIIGKFCFFFFVGLQLALTFIKEEPRAHPPPLLSQITCRRAHTRTTHARTSIITSVRPSHSTRRVD